MELAEQSSVATMIRRTDLASAEIGRKEKGCIGMAGCFLDSVYRIYDHQK